MAGRSGGGDAASGRGQAYACAGLLREWLRRRGLMPRVRFGRSGCTGAPGRAERLSRSEARVANTPACGVLMSWFPVDWFVVGALSTPVCTIALHLHSSNTG